MPGKKAPTLYNPSVTFKENLPAVSVWPLVPILWLGEKACTSTLVKTVPLASLTMPDIILLALEITKVWADFGRPASVKEQALGQPDIFNSSGLGITHAGAGGGPIIKPSLGMAGPMPTNHMPFCWGKERETIVDVAKAFTPGVTVCAVNWPAPPAKISIFSVAANVLAAAVNLMVRLTAEVVAVRVRFLVNTLVDVALIGAGWLNPKYPVVVPVGMTVGSVNKK